MNHQHIHWLGHSSFRIEDGATQIYFDPWKLAPVSPKADVVFITHAHYDHFLPASPSTPPQTLVTVTPRPLLT